MTRAKAKETLAGYLYLLPSLIVLGVFVFWPIGFSFVLSFFKWDFRNMKSPTFGFFSNYKEIFHFIEPPKYSFTEALIYTGIIVGLALIGTYLVVSIFKKKNRVFVYDLLILLGAISLIYIAKSSMENVYLASVISVVLLVYGIYELSRNRDYNISHFWSVFFLFIIFFVIFTIYLPLKTNIVSWLVDAKEKNDFLKALYNTTYYVILTVPITLAISLGVALLLNKNIKFRAAFRTAYFIPFVTSVVAISLVWQWIFNDDYGILNYFLSFFHIDRIAWLKDERWTIPTVAIVSIWKTIGYDAVIFLAGLQNIDKFYYEAADVDGANSFQKFMYITWPLLSPTTFFLTIVSFIGAFKVFTEIFVLYQGLPGPYNKSGLTMVYYVFDLFYNQQRMGLACAAAYLLFGIILIFTIIQYTVGKKMVEYVS